MRGYHSNESRRHAAPCSLRESKQHSMLLVSAALPIDRSERRSRMIAMPLPYHPALLVVLLLALYDVLLPEYFRLLVIFLAGLVCPKPAATYLEASSALQSLYFEQQAPLRQSVQDRACHQWRTMHMTFHFICSCYYISHINCITLVGEKKIHRCPKSPCA